MDPEQGSGTDTAQDRPHTRTGPQRRLIGNLLVREGLITPSQLQDALHAQSALETYTPLGQILVDRKALTRAQLNVVLDKYHKKNRLGDILVETNAITEKQLADALQYQKTTGLRLGEVLLQLNLLTEFQMKEALCKQFQVAFIDLDAVALDRNLAHVINRTYAQHHRVIPIAKLEERITVAMDDPAATEVIEDLRASTGCTIDVVTSTSAAFERACARLYEEGYGGVFLKAVHQAESERAMREQARHGAEHERERTLSELRAGWDGLVRQQETMAARLHELEQRQAELSRAPAELRAGQDRLTKGHETVASAGWLGDRQAEIAQTLHALHAAQEAIRRDGEMARQDLQKLATQQKEALQHIAELQAAYTALLSEQGTLAQVLRENREQHAAFVQDRQGTADMIEAVLRRLKA